MGDAVDFSSPAVGSDGRICVGSGDNNLYTLNSIGTLVWSYTTVNDIKSSPAINLDDGICVGSNDKNVYYFSSTGSFLWSYFIGTNAADIAESSPAIGDNGTIYVQARLKLLALNSTGSLLWSFSTAGAGAASHSSPALWTNGQIYDGASNSKILYSINSNCSLVWSYLTNGTLESSPVITSDGRAYIGSIDKNIYAFTHTGSLIWSYLTTHKVYSSPAI